MAFLDNPMAHAPSPSTAIVQDSGHLVTDVFRILVNERLGINAVASAVLAQISSTLQQSEVKGSLDRLLRSSAV